MLSPDRKEVGPQPISAPEIPKKNGHLPRWARVPAFAFRASLAILTATPAMAVAADIINRMENSSIVYDSGQQVSVDPQYNFDPPPQPTPTEVAQSPVVYKVWLCMAPRTTFPYEACPGPPPDRGYLSARQGGYSGINLRVGQTMEISATGRLLPGESRKEDILILKNKEGQDSPMASIIRSCSPYYDHYAEFDPEGYRYWGDIVCPPVNLWWDHLPKVYHPKAGLTGNIRPPLGGWRSISPLIFIGSHWKGGIDRDGELWLYVNSDETIKGAGGGFDITVTVYPTAEKKTEAVTIPTPQSSVTSITSTEKGFDLAGWLGGLGATLLAGLASYKFYERWKLRTRVAAGATTGTGSSVGSTPRIGGIAGVLGDPSNPNTAPSTGPTQPKNPEWIIGQQEFAKRWQDAKSKLSPLSPGDSGNEHGYILERFKTGMSIIHEVSLEDAIRVPTMATRVRAGMEYLIPEIWSNNRIFKRFFDPKFNAGFMTSEDLARILYLPEKYRSLPSFNNEQRRDIRRIRRVLMFALHPDTFQADSDKRLQDSIDDLLKKLNPAWSYIEKLIK